AHPDPGAAADRLDAADEHHRTEDAAETFEARREVDDPHRGPGGIGERRLDDRGVGDVTLLGREKFLDRGLEEAAVPRLASRSPIAVIEQAAEHRVAVEARQA